jgi:hypothetical protein
MGILLSTRLLVGSAATVVAAACLAQPAYGQFTKFSTQPRNILEGNWQSCRESDGYYSERIYDHIVAGAGQYEVHLGPRWEFAIFKGVQKEHRPHESPDNLLKPFRLQLENTLVKHRWEIPSLGIAFTASMGGGSRTECESWFIVLEPLEKPADAPADKPGDKSINP